MRKLAFAVTVIALGAPGCNCQGPKGSVGPAGPLADPPHILAVSPEAGSWRNTVTITGENFVDGANTVYFDGDTATIVSESATQIVVEPTATFVEPAEGVRLVAISVITAQQASNAFAWEALPSGTPAFTPSSVPSQISDITSDGTMIYFADLGGGILSADSGKSFATGQVRGLGSTLKRPVALAYHDTYGLVVVDDISVAGDLSREQVLAVNEATGDIQVLIGVILGLANATDVAVDPANGDIYIVTDPAGATNPVWRLSDTDGLEAGWGNANLDSAINSVAVVGANVYVGGTGANTGLFQFVAGSGGGGAVNTLKALDVGVVPVGLAPHGTDLMVLQNAGLANVANLGMSPSNVTAFNNFSMAGGERVLAAVGTGFAWGGQANGNGQSLFSMFAPDADNEQLMTESVVYGLIYGGFRIANDVYFGSYPSCVFTNGESASFLRLDSSGSTQVVSTGNSCAYGSAATSTGLIATSHQLDNTVSTIDPATGTATQILDAGDGVETPLAVMVGPNDAVYVTHAPGGQIYIGLTDATGSSFDPTWAGPFSYAPMVGGTLGNQFLVTQLGALQLDAIDPSDGSVTPNFVEQTQLSGLIYSLQPTAQGTLAASFLDPSNNTSGGMEILDSAVVWELFRADPTAEISLPLGLAPVANGSYLMAEFDQTQTEGFLVTVTP